MRYFLTADTHFGHGNIIEYCDRPFKNADDMNEKLITNWNMRVKTEDTVFIIGDFCFRADKTVVEKVGAGKEKASFWMDRLNGSKILVKGNHDNNNSAKTIIECIHITFANRRINLCHKPEHVNYDFPINFVGHVHNAWKIQKRSTPGAYGPKETILFNVGVDVNRYMPITIDEALGEIARFERTGEVKWAKT